MPDNQELSQLISTYQTHPQFFEDSQVDQLETLAKAADVPFQRQLDYEEANLLEIPQQLLGGFISGFTAFIDPFEAPKTIAGKIAKGIGHLSGFVGVLFPPLTFLRAGWTGLKVAQLGAGAVSAAGKIGAAYKVKGLAEWAGEAIRTGAAMKFTSVPMMASDFAMSHLGKLSAFKKAAEVLKGKPGILKALEGASHLGIASSVSSLKDGIDEALMSGVQGFIMGGAFSKIGDVNWVKGNTTANNIIKMTAGSLAQGLPGTMYGLSVPEQIYEYLLGGYFGFHSKDTKWWIGAKFFRGKSPLEIHGRKLTEEYINASEADKKDIDTFYELQWKPKAVKQGLFDFVQPYMSEDQLDKSNALKTLSLTARKVEANKKISEEGDYIQQRTTDEKGNHIEGRVVEIAENGMSVTIETPEGKRVTLRNDDWDQLIDPKPKEKVVEDPTGKSEDDIAELLKAHQASDDAIGIFLDKFFGGEPLKGNERAGHIQKLKDILANSIDYKDGNKWGHFLGELEKFRVGNKLEHKLAETDYAQLVRLFNIEVDGKRQKYSMLNSKGELLDYTVSTFTDKVYDPAGNRVSVKRPRNLFDHLYNDDDRYILVPYIEAADYNGKIQMVPSYQAEGVLTPGELPKRGAKRNKEWDPSYKFLWSTAYKAARKRGYYFYGVKGESGTFIYMKLHPEVEASRKSGKTSERLKEIQDQIFEEIPEYAELVKNAKAEYVKSGSGDEKDFLNEHFSNLLYWQDINGGSKVDWSKLREGGFLQSVLEHNKRQQILFSDYASLQEDIIGPEPFRMAILADPVNWSEAMKKAFEKYPKLGKALTDGAILLDRDTFDRIARGGGLPPGLLSSMKPFIIQHNADLGALLAKAAFHIMPDELSAAMKKSGPNGEAIHMLAYSSAVKQKGTRAINEAGFFEGGKFGTIDGKPLTIYNIKAQDIKLSVGTRDNAAESLYKRKKFAIQVIKALGNTKSEKKMRKALTKFFETQIAGTDEANKVFDEWWDTLEESPQKTTLFGKLFMIDPETGDFHHEAAIHDIGYHRMLKAFQATSVSGKMFRQALRKYMLGFTAEDVDFHGDVDPDIMKDLDNSITKLLMIGNTSDAISIARPTRDMMEAVYANFFIRRLTTPHLRQAGKAVMYPLTPDLMVHSMFKNFDTDNDHFFLGSAYERLPLFVNDKWTTLGAAYESRKDLNPKEQAELDKALTALVLRVPMDAVSGQQPLKFGGFIPGVRGGAILLPNEIMNRLGGADLDIDTAFFYFGLPHEYLGALEGVRDEQEKLGQYVGNTQMLFGEKFHSKLDKTDPKVRNQMFFDMFNPLKRGMVGSAVAKGRQVMLGQVINASFLVQSFYDMLPVKSKIYKFLIGDVGEVILTPRKNDFYIRLAKKAALNLAVDLGGTAEGFVSRDEMLGLLMHAAFEKAVFRGKNGKKVDLLEGITVDYEKGTKTVKNPGKWRDFTRAIQTTAEWKNTKNINSKFWGKDYTNDRKWSALEMADAARQHLEDKSAIKPFRDHPLEPIIRAIAEYRYRDSLLDRQLPYIKTLAQNFEEMRNILYADMKAGNTLFPFLPEGHMLGASWSAVTTRLELIKEFFQKDFSQWSPTLVRKVAGDEKLFNAFFNRWIDTYRKKGTNRKYNTWAEFMDEHKIWRYDVFAKSRGQDTLRPNEKGREKVINDLLDRAESYLFNMHNDYGSLAWAGKEYRKVGFASIPGGQELARTIFRAVEGLKNEYHEYFTDMYLEGERDPAKLSHLMKKIDDYREHVFSRFHGYKRELTDPGDAIRADYDIDDVTAAQLSRLPENAVRFFDALLIGALRGRYKKNRIHTGYSRLGIDNSSPAAIRRWIDAYTEMFTVNTSQAESGKAAKALGSYLVNKTQEEDVRELNRKVIHQVISKPQAVEITERQPDAEVTYLFENINKNLEYYVSHMPDKKLALEDFWKMMQGELGVAQPSDFTLDHLRLLNAKLNSWRRGPGFMRQFIDWITGNKDMTKYTPFMNSWHFWEYTDDVVKRQYFKLVTERVLDPDGNFRDSSKPLGWRNPTTGKIEDVYSDVARPLTEFTRLVDFARAIEDAQSAMTAKASQLLNDKFKELIGVKDSEGKAIDGDKFFEVAIIYHELNKLEKDWKKLEAKKDKSKEDLEWIHSMREIYEYRTAERARVSPWYDSVKEKLFRLPGKEEEVTGLTLIKRMETSIDEAVKWAWKTLVEADKETLHANLKFKKVGKFFFADNEESFVYMREQILHSVRSGQTIESKYAPKDQLVRYNKYIDEIHYRAMKAAVEQQRKYTLEDIEKLRSDKLQKFFSEMEDLQMADVSGMLRKITDPEVLKDFTRGMLYGIRYKDKTFDTPEEERIFMLRTLFPQSKRLEEAGAKLPRYATHQMAGWKKGQGLGEDVRLEKQIRGINHYFGHTFGTHDIRRKIKSIETNLKREDFLFSQFELDKLRAMTLADPVKAKAEERFIDDYRWHRLTMENDQPFYVTEMLEGYFPHINPDPREAQKWATVQIEKILGNKTHSPAGANWREDLSALTLADKIRVGEIHQMLMSVRNGRRVRDSEMLEAARELVEASSEEGKLIRDDVYRDVNGETASTYLETKEGYTRMAFASMRREAQMWGYAKNLDALTTYLSSMQDAIYKNFFALTARREIEAFEASKAMGENTELWGRELRMHAARILGLPSYYPESWMNDPRMKLRRLPSYYTTDHFWYNQTSKIPRIAAKLWGEHWEEQVGISKAKFAMQMRSLSTLEGKYALLTLLSSARSFVNNVFLGKGYEWVYVGSRNLFAANKFSSWQHLNPKGWKSMEDVNRSIIEWGGLEDWIAHEGNMIVRRHGPRGTKFVEALMGKLKQDPLLSDKDVFTLGKEYGIWNSIQELAAWPMRKSERMIRLHTFKSAYLQIRESLAPLSNLAYDNTFVLEKARQAVAATQFLYSNANRPPFAGTNMGAIVSRFKIWTWNSVRLQRKLFSEAKLMGFRQDSVEMERFNRMMVLNMFVLGLASLIPNSMFENNLPPPLSQFQQFSDWIFGSDRERERAFYAGRAGIPTVLAPLNELNPSSTRIAKGIYDLPTSFGLIWSGEFHRLGEYQTLMLAPFGRQFNDIFRAMHDPRKALDYMTGIPMNKIADAKERKN